MADRLHVFVEGRVQGVGFRYATCRQARALRLTGWVRNLPDGRVEAIFEGSKHSLDQVLEWCRRGPAFAKVIHLDETWEDAPHQFSDFLPVE